jgi:hypothetical protein
MKQKRIGENDQELVIPAVYVNGDAKQWAAMTMRRHSENGLDLYTLIRP